MYLTLLLNTNASICFDSIIPSPMDQRVNITGVKIVSNHPQIQTVSSGFQFSVDRPIRTVKRFLAFQLGKAFKMKFERSILLAIKPEYIINYFLGFDE